MAVDLIYNVKFNIDSSELDKMKGASSTKGGASTSSIKNTTKAVEDQNKAVKRLVESTKEHISENSKLKNSLDLSLKSIGANSKATIASVNNAKKRIASIKAQKAEITKLSNSTETSSKETAALNNLYARLTSQEKQLIAGIQRYRSEINKTEVATKSYTGSQKMIGVQVGENNKKFASANQAIFSFSDLVQDSAQFSQGYAQGMRAIGNNISYTAELFGVLSRKAKESNMTFTQALKGAFTPVNLAILGLNVALTASQFLLDKFSGGVDDASDYLEDFASQAASLRDSGAFDFLGVRQLESQLNVLDRQQGTIQEILDQIDMVRKASARTGERDLQELRLKNLEESLGITSKEARKLADNLSDSRKELEGLSRIAKLDPLGVFKSNLEDVSSNALLNFSLGIDIIGESAKREAGKIQQAIIDLRRELPEGKDNYDFLDSIGVPKEDRLIVMDNLQKQLDKLSDVIPDIPTAEVFPPNDVIIDNIEEIDSLLKNELSMLNMMVPSKDEKKKVADDINKFLVTLNNDTIKAFDNSSTSGIKAMQDQITQQVKDGANDRAEVYRKEAEIYRLQQLAKAQYSQIGINASQAFSDILRGLFGENKAIASAEALVSTYFAASKAYEAQMKITTPDNIIRAKVAAGVAIAQGLARVAMINRVQPNGGGGSGSASSGGGSGGGIINSTNLTQAPTPVTFMPTAQSQGSNVTVKNEVLVDDRGLAMRTRVGEREIRNTQKSVG